MTGKPRAGVAMALHVLELVHAFHRSAETKRQIAIKHRCKKPALLG